MMNKKIGILVGIAFSSSTLALAASPSEFKVKVYKFAISKNADCSSPTTIFNDAAGIEKDFLLTPDLGSGAASDGTYPCLIMEMSSVLKFKPATTSGSCTAGTQYTINVCHSGSTSTLTDGTVVTCTTTQADTTGYRVAVYISTNATNDGSSTFNNSCTGTECNAFEAPTTASSKKGIKLSSALVVAGDKSGTFVVNATDKIDGTQSSCDLQPPVFSFK